MIELTSILLIIMAIGITVTSIEYYKQIIKAKKEYDKAKRIIEDIVLSFNRELKREANKLEIITIPCYVCQDSIWNYRRFQIIIS